VGSLDRSGQRRGARLSFENLALGFARRRFHVHRLLLSWELAMCAVYDAHLERIERDPEGAPTRRPGLRGPGCASPATILS
jgi:hypothetical protein